MKRLGWSHWALRDKLIAICILVQVIVIAFVLWNSTRLLQRTLLAQATSHTRQVVALLDETIAVPLAQRDYAALQQAIDSARSDDAIDYLVLKDHLGKVVVASGWDMKKALPPRDIDAIDLHRADTTLHTGAPVIIAGQQLGELCIGLSTLSLRAASSDFLTQGVAVAVAALLASAIFLAAFAYAITRHLATLAQATRRVADGDFDVSVSVNTDDEIGRLATVFNSMALALKQRVAALEQSKVQQRFHLDTARTGQARLTALLEAMQSGILFVDAAGEISYVNTAFSRIWSISEPLTGRSLSEVIPILTAQTSPADATHLTAMLRRRSEDAMRADGELHTLDGRLISQRMQVVRQGAQDIGCIWFHYDITAERQTQQRAYQALHDPLTQLMNRRGLYESLQAAITRADDEQSSLALMFIDLDDFKRANDIGGHRTGDEVLIAIARIFSDQLRNGEIVARLGGDEFAVLCTGAGAAAATRTAAVLVAAVDALRFPAAGTTLRVGCSIGIARYPDDALTEDDLMARADAAMYRAKQRGKNTWALYEQEVLAIK